MTNTREANAVCGVPAGETREEGFYAKVGLNFPYHNKNSPIVTRITVSDDLPGLHCNLERVRVFAEGDKLLWEGPMHNLEGVWYV
jgi:hypothetical protein